MRWIWDERKNRINKRKHYISFETASLVFADPLTAHRQDSGSNGEIWHSIGQIGEIVVIVAHTWPGMGAGTGEEVGRIVSARKATGNERKAYEEGWF